MRESLAEVIDRLPNSIVQKQVAVANSAVELRRDKPWLPLHPVRVLCPRLEQGIDFICGRCEPCRRGRLIDCRNLRIPGVTYDGGYTEAMVTSAEGLAVIPDDLAATDAAPLLCAGVTTYNALRQSGAMACDVVAILGIGGLGHLGVQFAARMGFYTVPIARGRDKENLARSLGAHVYVDSKSEDVVATLNKLGGARVVLSTVTFGKRP